MVAVATTTPWPAARNCRLRQPGWLEGADGHGERGEREGFCTEAHRGAVGRVSGLGGAPEWPNRRRRAPGPKLEDDGDGGCSGPFWSRETTRRTGAEQRSFWNWRRGEGGLVAAAMANGGDGCARGSQGREGKREPEEGERSRGRGEVRGGSGRRVASPGRRGGSRRWPGGSRRWPRPLGRAPRLASVRPPGRGGR